MMGLDLLVNDFDNTTQPGRPKSIRGTDAALDPRSKQTDTVREEVNAVVQLSVWQCVRLSDICAYSSDSVYACV